MSQNQNAGKSHNLKLDTRSFEMVEGFKYLGTILTHQNSIQEEIKNKIGGECSMFEGEERHIQGFVGET